MENKKQAIKIGIIGAGFSGVTLAANIHRFSSIPVEIYLFEKTGNFGLGAAYSSPFAFHLLNVRAVDMSGFEDDPMHFVNWMKLNSAMHPYLNLSQPIEEQFVPRLCYGHYLQDLLRQIQATSAPVKLTLEPCEVVDVIKQEAHSTLLLKDGRQLSVDKTIFALGNNLPPIFPFPVEDVNCIHHPWDYTAPTQIANNEPVLIVGTGLSMIDIVLTLHEQKHQNFIYAVSRHGLMPLSHANSKVPFLLIKDDLPADFNQLTKYLRAKIKCHLKEGGDWRAVINALRAYIPAIWSQISLADKQRFLRHMLPYWNVHRHRVNHKIADLLSKKTQSGELHVISGRLVEVKKGMARIKIRHTEKIKEVPVKWLVNCMGPSLISNALHQPLITALISRKMVKVDDLGLGLMTTAHGELQNGFGQPSSIFYALGPLRRGMVWESGAVPEIRKQSFNLAKHLLNEV